jgi:murein DD-endopeptidase MepM/ murein hydrolase activator NlpD
MIFANIMQDKERLNTFWKKLLHKYRFVIMTDDSFEERLSVKLSRLNVVTFSGFVIFTCFFLTVLLITSTPLKEYIPGKSNTQVKKELIELAIKSDSLETKLYNRDVYLQNINNIITGGELITPSASEAVQQTDGKISFEKSKEDSILRTAVESEEKGSIIIKKNNSNDFLVFFSPVNGMITDRFDNKTKHFGIDLVAKEKTRISSVLEGTVVISTWTSETGYIIGIQHKNDYFSLYKHNSVLLKSVGDFVNASDHIAIIGNSGELSSGPHLHFELWHQGTPVNPENYISF